MAERFAVKGRGFVGHFQAVIRRRAVVKILHADE